ncbi:hypothetical protein N0M98_09915 [Paenibacillus doosanensis]|nr:hypothetical protein [Paenibacillus doosanensis]
MFKIVANCTRPAVDRSFRTLALRIPLFFEPLIRKKASFTKATAAAVPKLSGRFLTNPLVTAYIQFKNLLLTEPCCNSKAFVEPEHIRAEHS